MLLLGHKIGKKINGSNNEESIKNIMVHQPTQAQPFNMLSRGKWNSGTSHS